MAGPVEGICNFGKTIEDGPGMHVGESVDAVGADWGPS